MTYNGYDFRGVDKMFSDFNGAYFINCKIDRRTNFRNSDFRGAVFVNTPIELASIGGSLGNMKEICSLQIEGRPIIITKSNIQIDCVTLPVRKFAKQELLDIVKKHPKSSISKQTMKYKDILYEIWNLKFNTKQEGEVQCLEQ